MALMKALAVLLACAHVACAARSLYDLAAVDIDGNLVSLSKYRGSVSLVVNVASYCGLTKANYEQLQAIQQQLGRQGRFQVLAFPCNQFNSQEPKSNSEIKRFAWEGYGASFPLFAKTTVNPPMCQGSASACTAASEQCCPSNTPIYRFLKSHFDGAIQWNFEKFLVNEQGIPIHRYPPTTDPESILPDIQRALLKATQAAGANISGVTEPGLHDTL